MGLRTGVDCNQDRAGTMRKSTETRRYIEGLPCPRGSGAGKPFRVLPWQSRFLKSVCDERPRISLLSIPRGNGKSTFIGAIAAAIVGGPLALDNVENIVISSTMDAAGYVFDAAKIMLGIAPNGKHPFFRARAVSNYQEIENLENGTVLKIAAASDVSNMGAGFQYALCDEVAFWRRGEATFNVLKTSQGKIDDAQIICLGTRPLSSDTGHFYNKLLANPDYTKIVYDYTGPAPLSMAAVRAANPSYAAFPPLQKALKAELKEARKDADAAAAFRAFRLNDGSAYDLSKVEDGLIDLETWKAVCETDAASMPGAQGPFVAGLDLGGAMSWTAAALYWPGTGLLIARAWMPSFPTIETRAKREHIELPLYRKLVTDGDLTVKGNRVVPAETPLNWIFSTYGNPAAIVTDRYREAEALEAVEKSDCTAPLVVRGTGYQSADEDTRAFQAYALDGRVKAPVSALMRLALGDTQLARDASGAQKITKKRRYAKNDPVAAAVLAVSHAKRNPIKEGRRAGRVFIGGRAL